jgi:hypothetical protein
MSQRDSSLFYLKATEAKTGRLYMRAYQDYKDHNSMQNPAILRDLGLTEVELENMKKPFRYSRNYLRSLLPIRLPFPAG